MLFVVMQNAETGILALDRLLVGRRRLKESGRSLVFTNGCFDVLHRGHVEYLAFARSLGDALAVGVNSDASVRRLKGPHRPIVAAADRASVLAALRVVDYVVIFDAADPSELIGWLRPDVLVKGEDWAHNVSGREVVESYGGRVVLAPYLPGWSTSAIIESVRRRYTGENQ